MCEISRRVGPAKTEFNGFFTVRERVAFSKEMEQIAQAQQPKSQEQTRVPGERISLQIQQAER